VVQEQHRAASASPVPRSLLHHMAYVLGQRHRTIERALQLLPMETTLPNGSRIVLTPLDEAALEACRLMFNLEMQQGISYPQDFEHSPEQFRAYFWSHEAFVARVVAPDGGEAPSAEAASAAVAPDAAAPFTPGAVVGMFYIKPNFPGRSSHICNGGFVVAAGARRQGIARFLAGCFLPLARALGYEASMFNLVYVNNTASLTLWRSLGFRELGVVPRAGRLADGSYVDAVQFYYDLTTLTLPPDPPQPQPHA